MMRSIALSFAILAWTLGATAALAAPVASATTMAGNGYVQFNLTSNVSGAAAHTDAHLVNGWGLAFFPTGPFWVSDNGSGFSTLYDHNGDALSLVVKIPAAKEAPHGTPGSPAGLVANATSDFTVTEGSSSGPAAFIYSSNDGTISGWSPSVDVNKAVIAVDNFPSHSLYTGLALATDRNGTRLFAADAANNRVDAFDGSFHKLFSFTDPMVPAGLSAYGVRRLHDVLFVTFASPVPGQGGVIDIFDTNGNLLRRFAQNGPNGPLDAPWGIALAPKGFGLFSGDLLVGNVGDGHISAYDPISFRFLGQLHDLHGNKIAIPGLWALEFGAGNSANGSQQQLFFTAGPDGYGAGLFGMIVAR